MDEGEILKIDTRTGTVCGEGQVLVLWVIIERDRVNVDLRPPRVYASRGSMMPCDFGGIESPVVHVEEVREHDKRRNQGHLDEKLGVERSLKKFKRMCESFGVIREYRKRQEYKKPSIRLKEKRVAAEKRRKKNQMKYMRGSGI